MRHGALRLATLGLLVLCLACSGDTISPTSPALDSDSPGSLSAQKKKPGGGKGGGKSTTRYTFDITGDVVSSRSIIAAGDVTNFHGDENSGITMDVSFLAAFDDEVDHLNFDVCFPESVTREATPGAVLLNRETELPTEATASITFRALNGDGDTVIGYALTAIGTTAGAFLPVEIGDTATLSMTEWMVTNISKSQRRKNPCRGSGSFNMTILVTRTE